MKKKLLCLLLCFTLFLTVGMLGGCAAEDEVNLNSNVNTSRNAVTISMWIVSENKVSAETEKLVENAFNEVSEAKYTTHVDLIFCTKDEYKAKVDAQLAKSAGRPSGTSINPATKGENYVQNEEGMWVLAYPAVGEYQMDILLITNEDMLTEYVEGKHLKSLNESLTNTYKIIGRYVYNKILDNAKVNGEWFAVPNNQMIGEYTFMMVNREMAERYYFDESSFTSFGIDTSAAKLIDLIAEKEDLNVIAPMYEMADYPLVKYWNKNHDGKSIISTLYPTALVEAGSSFAPSVSNLFAAGSYKSFMQEMFYCKENGYFLTTQEKFGVGIMSGDYSLYSQYIEDYYVIPLSYPRLEDTDVFGSMFAISNYTVSEQRSMEIIKDLTCDSELRNILQYGVMDTHYELDEDGAVKRLNHDYMMDIRYTGNVMMAYPEEDAPLTLWNDAKKQNLESLLSGVFGSSGFLKNVNEEAWRQMSDVSASYFERLYTCETVNEFEKYLVSASAEISATSYFSELTNTFTSAGDFDTKSLAGSLSQWWTDTFGSLT